MLDNQDLFDTNNYITRGINTQENMASSIFQYTGVHWCENEPLHLFNGRCPGNIHLYLPNNDKAVWL